MGYHATVMLGPACGRQSPRPVPRLVGSWPAAALLGGVAALLLPALGCRDGSVTGPPTAAGRPVPPPPPKQLLVTAVGGITFDRRGRRALEESGPQGLLAPLRDRMRAADLTFACLECPFLQPEQAEPEEAGEPPASPAVEALARAGIDAVAITDDWWPQTDREELRATLQALERAGIAYAGADPEGRRGGEATLLPVGDTTVAFLAYTDRRADSQLHASFFGHAPSALAAVREARNKADVVIVSYLWGEVGLGQAEPTEGQRELGHATVEAGADLVLGYGPGVLGGVERHGDGLILYSLGRLLGTGRGRGDEEAAGAIFTVGLTKGQKTSLVITPTRMEPSEGVARPAPEEAGSAVLERLSRLSRELGTPLQVDGNKAKASFALSSAAGAPTRPAG